MRFLLTLMLCFCLSMAGLAQTTIEGTVATTEEVFLPYATVHLMGSLTGTLSNVNGEFRLEAPANEKVYLITSYVGFRSDTTELMTAEGKNEVTIRLERTVIDKAEFVVTGVRATAKTPVAFDNLSGEELQKENLGVDVPILLNRMPSVVTSSDAGAGVGYTDMRVRGTDQTRINVTINGVPLNDAESQNVFWVDLPDFASSTAGIQVQRGVGTSTNGAAAFGATVNLQSEKPAQKAYAESNFTYGSFNTQKANLSFGSGLLNGRWAFQGRLSQISSDGYIDRASSDLSSYYLSAGYYGKKTTIQLLNFGGHERTYQSWFGTPEAALTGDRDAKLEYISTEGLSDAEAQNLLNSDRRYNHYLYEDQVDDYGQTHYQLAIDHQLEHNINATVTFHYTKGAGYFEQFREDDDFSDYGLTDRIIGSDTISSADFIRRRWLDNDFYGAVFSLRRVRNKLAMVLGGGYSIYEGDHFGEIIWAEYAVGTSIYDRYYDNVGRKTDGNIYLKANYQWTDKLNIYGDIQYRGVTYQTAGIDNDLRNINIDETFAFFNPKAGANFQINNKNRIYASVAMAGREPSRSDYLDAAITAPVEEQLIDYELGYERSSQKYFFKANAFYMDYTNQLVLTGELNDVGSSVKTNVADSYRTGLELQFQWQLAKKLSWYFNYTFSLNKIQDFNAIVYDYTNGFDVVTRVLSNTDIALSPQDIAAGEWRYTPFEVLEVSVLSKYVGSQFLDNTSDPNRMIEASLVHDLRLIYTPKVKRLKNVAVTLRVNNLLDEEYSTKGYTYSYIFGEEIVRNHYYPQATRNFLLGLNLKF